MPRIRPVDLGVAPPPSSDRAARIQYSLGTIMGHCPDAAGGVGATTKALFTGSLGPRLVELIRLRIAFHNQCRSCMAMRYADAVDDGINEDLICSLERPGDAEDLTDGERAALRFADLFATNHLAIDDAVYDELRRYFTESQLVEIGLNCAIDLGMGRLAATWHVTDDLPERFQRPDDIVTPWGGDGIVMPSPA